MELSAEKSPLEILGLEGRIDYDVCHSSGVESGMTACLPGWDQAMSPFPLTTE